MIVTVSQCPECGNQSVKAFVRHGSFFTRCVSCSYRGPAASWLGVYESLDGAVQAQVVNEKLAVTETLGVGTASSLFAKVREAARAGNLVLLSSAPAGA